MKNKRVLAVIVLVFFLFGQVNESKAVLPFALAPEAVAVMAGLLTAAGIHLATDDSARGVVLQTWERASDGLKNAVLSASAGVVFVTSAIWYELKELIGLVEDGVVSGEVFTGRVDFSLYNTEGQVINIGEPATVRLNFTAMDYGTSSGANYIYFRGPVNGYIKISPSREYDGGVLQYYYYVQVEHHPVYKRVYQSQYGDKVPGDVVVAVGEGISVLVNGIEVWSTEGTGYEVNRIELKSSMSGYCSGTVMTTSAFSTTLVRGENWDIDTDVYSNPTWDLSNRKVTIPTTLDGVVGKTAEEVIQEVEKTYPPDIDEDVGTVTGWLSNVYNGIQNLAGTLQGIATKVTSLPMSIAQAISDTVVGEIETVSIEPLVGALSGVTNKFPFSLPWDLKRAIEAVAVPDSGPPEIHTSVTIGGYICPVDIVIPEQISDMVVYFRWALLLLWDVGLIFILATLMRGAS